MTFLAWFALVAIAELALFIWVGSLIGLGWTLGIALATALIGAFLVKRAGISVLARIREKIGSGQVPGRELTHGAAILVSGALLITPGLITDTLGFILIVPAVRDLIHGYVTRRIGRRWNVVQVNLHGTPTEIGDQRIIDVEEID